MDNLFLPVLYNKSKLSKLIIIELNDNKYAYNKLIIEEFNVNPNSFTKNKGYRLFLFKKDGKVTSYQTKFVSYHDEREIQYYGINNRYTYSDYDVDCEISYQDNFFNFNFNFIDGEFNYFSLKITSRISKDDFNSFLYPIDSKNVNDDNFPILILDKFLVLKRNDTELNFKINEDLIEISSLNHPLKNAGFLNIKISLKVSLVHLFDFYFDAQWFIKIENKSLVYKESLNRYFYLDTKKEREDYYIFNSNYELEKIDFILHKNRKKDSDLITKFSLEFTPGLTFKKDTNFGEIIFTYLDDENKDSPLSLHFNYSINKYSQDFHQILIKSSYIENYKNTFFEMIIFDDYDSKFLELFNHFLANIFVNFQENDIRCTFCFDFKKHQED